MDVRASSLRLQMKVAECVWDGGLAYLDHTGSIVADEGLDVLGVSHFSPAGKARAKVQSQSKECRVPARLNLAHLNKNSLDDDETANPSRLNNGADRTISASETVAVYFPDRTAKCGRGSQI
jgi:hypothetical protein